VKEAAVIGPTYFKAEQRQATKQAGAITGLNVLSIINEPTAAAIAFGMNMHSKDVRHVLIFDLGGDMWNVSLLDIHGGIFEVRATSGDIDLGAEDFDNQVIIFFADRFQKKFKSDLRGSPRALWTLQTASERARPTLSTAMTASIICDSL
jgi:L1 cell adhesion molecule like protein